MAGLGAGHALANDKKSANSAENTTSSRLPPPRGFPGEEKSGNSIGSYWNIAFSGGLLIPTGAMSQTHKGGLIAEGKVGWTSKIGIGAELSAAYSPLPTTRTQANGVQVDSDYFLLSLAPKITLGRNTLRLWISIGGGATIERTEKASTSSHMNNDMSTTSTVTSISPSASASGGIEAHILAGGGIYVSSTYTRSLGSFNHENYRVSSGLVLSF